MSALVGGWHNPLPATRGGITARGSAHRLARPRQRAPRPGSQVVASPVDQRQGRPGARVMVVARNSTDVYEIMLAAWRIGAVFMLVTWPLAPSELAGIVARGRPTLVIADESVARATRHASAGQAPAATARSPRP